MKNSLNSEKKYNVIKMRYITYIGIENNDNYVISLMGCVYQFREEWSKCEPTLVLLQQPQPDESQHSGERSQDHALCQTDRLTVIKQNR